jgi:galactose mutarotase-like enzyme
VLFTPTSRDAVAIEPYTCPTDAVHLEAARDRCRLAGPAGRAQTQAFTWRIDIS